MRKLALLCALAMALSTQAGAVTSYIDTFNGSYSAGAIGPQPSGWSYFGFGAPAYSTQETGIVLAPNDGTNSAWRVDVPGSVTNEDPFIALYRNINLNDFALPGQPIDFSKPITVTADVYGNDIASGTKFYSEMFLIGYNASSTGAEFGDNGFPSGTWQQVSNTVAAGTANPTTSGTVYLALSVDNLTGFAGNNTLIWENLRMDYTPVPEPGTLLALGSGLAGFVGMVSRRKR